MGGEWRKGWFGPQRGAVTVKGLRGSPSGRKGWVLYIGFFPIHLTVLAAAVVFHAPGLVWLNALLVAGLIAATRLLYDETPPAPPAPPSPRHPNPPAPVD